MECCGGASNNSIFAVEVLRDFLERGITSFDIEELKCELVFHLPTWQVS
jgi:hypothetical protein